MRIRNKGKQNKVMVLTFHLCQVFTPSLSPYFYAAELRVHDLLSPAVPLCRFPAAPRGTGPKAAVPELVRSVWSWKSPQGHSAKGLYVLLPWRRLEGRVVASVK